jgi:hypothetical protein
MYSDHKIPYTTKKKLEFYNQKNYGVLSIWAFFGLMQQQYKHTPSKPNNK